jgi:hypothetical protein
MQIRGRWHDLAHALLSVIDSEPDNKITVTIDPSQEYAPREYTSTPTPSPVDTGSGNAGKRYVPTVDTTRYETHKEHWRVWDTQEDMPFVGMGKPEYYALEAEAQAACDTLNAQDTGVQS